MGGEPVRVRKPALSRETACFLLIFVCFLWTSSAYLSWMYRLTEFFPDSSLEFFTEVVGYLFQALGLALFALAVRLRPQAAGRVAFAAVVAADLLCAVPALLCKSLPSLLTAGYGMNLFHGAAAGAYLHRLALDVDWQKRSKVFGFGYGAASVGAWLLSLPGGGNFLRAPAVLAAYAVLAAATVGLFFLRPPARRPALSPSGDPPAPRLVALAGGTVVLISLVKNLGFSFPAADLSQGVDLELSRIFYAVGLVIAGIVGDRRRKYGAVCCVASLGFPFLLMALSDRLGPSIVVWGLGYFFFGFFTVFRAVLFCDLASRAGNGLYLAGAGLLFGRFGDSLGTLFCVLLSGSPLLLVGVSAALFAAVIALFFLLYHRVYTPAPVREMSDQERFDLFAERYELSRREQEILKLVLAGQSNPEMAAGLYVSESTVKFHVHNVLKKTSCENRLSLVSRYRSETR